MPCTYCEWISILLYIYFTGFSCHQWWGYPVPVQPISSSGDGSTSTGGPLHAVATPWILVSEYLKTCSNMCSVIGGYLISPAYSFLHWLQGLLCRVKGDGARILQIRGLQEDDSRAQPHILGMSITSVVFSQFADCVRVVSIPRQIQTDFVKLATLFQGTLKFAVRRHKCDDTLTHPPPPKKLLSVFGDFKWQPPPPGCIGSQGFLKVEKWR
jgi:hypothetical protein